MLLLFLPFRLIILQLRKRRPTDNKRKPTKLVGGGTTPVQMGPRDATTPPHAEHTGCIHYKSPKFLEKAKKFQSQEKKKKTCFFYSFGRVIIFNLARRAEELRDTPTELTEKDPHRFPPLKKRKRKSLYVYTHE